MRMRTRKKRDVAGTEAILALILLLAVASIVSLLLFIRRHQVVSHPCTDPSLIWNAVQCSKMKSGSVSAVSDKVTY